MRQPGCRSNLLLGRERRRLLMSDIRFHEAAAALLRSYQIPLHDTARSVQSLSGGQRQLVAVARAMTRNPRLLLLDEPTAALGVTESAQVEELIAGLRQRGTTIVLACHDIDQMFRLADRIVVLRHGRVVADVDPDRVHPDDVVALVSGQQVDSSARRQLTRLHGLADRLVSADPSSSLSLILSALGAALNSERLCIHLRTGDTLACAASLGLPEGCSPPGRRSRGPAGGPVGVAAATEKPVIEDNVRAAAAWAPFSDLARTAKVGARGRFLSWARAAWSGSSPSSAARPAPRSATSSTWSRSTPGTPPARSSATGCWTRSPRATGCWRRSGRCWRPWPGPSRWPRGFGGAAGAAPGAAGGPGRAADHGARRGRAAGRSSARRTGRAPRAGSPRPCSRRPSGCSRSLAATTWRARCGFPASSPWRSRSLRPAGPTALLAGWRDGPPTADATALMEDAAHSLRLALEREEAGLAHQEATALRRSQELQRDFLSRLSHELRTPLTAIRGTPPA